MEGSLPPDVGCIQVSLRRPKRQRRNNSTHHTLCVCVCVCVGGGGGGETGRQAQRHRKARSKKEREIDGVKDRVMFLRPNDYCNRMPELSSAAQINQYLRE